MRDYATLQERVADWLNRGDLSARIPDFIQLAEDRLRRDVRVRNLTCRGTLALVTDGDALPADFGSVEAWYHDGPTLHGEIRIVGAEQLGRLKAQLGDSGAPQYAAVSGGRLFYAPVPDDIYNTRFSYHRKIEHLSDENPTNWLLEGHSDIYLYATLMESAPYLADDERIPMWETTLNSRLEDLRRSNWEEQWSGTMRQGPRRGRAIGG